MADPYSFDIEALCKKSPYGILARPEFLLELQLEERPLAKLLVPVSLRDIAERNGECGKSFWIVIGKDVFDLTGDYLCDIIHEGCPANIMVFG